MKILVVDDNKVNLRLFKGVLEKKGHTVLTAENGKQGLERLLVADDVDLIISDILMPVMDGYQFCQQVNLIDRFKHIPFIFCTGTYTEEKDEALAYKFGASYFLRKESSSAMLGEIVEKVMSDIKSGRIQRKSPESISENETYKLYSERLVTKLEEKMQQLDKEVIAMEQEAAERQKMQDALRTGKEFAENLFESAPAIMLILDSDGRIVRFNPFMEKVCGYSNEEVRGKEWNSVFQPEPVSPGNDFPHDVDAGAGPEPISRCTSIRTREGRRREIEWNEKDLLDRNGHTIGLLAVGQDVTDRLKMQQSLDHARKFEAIGRLAGGIAHDFNNLLAIILGSIALAEDDVAAHIGESEYLKTAKETALRAKALTSRLTVMSKSEMEIRHAVEIRKLVGEAIVAAVEHSETLCEIKAADDLWMVSADPDQIHQVIYDIILNAVEAMNGNSRVTVRLDNRRVRPNDDLPLAPGRYVKIAIDDTGPGIAEHLLPEIFDPYFSTKETADRKGSGLGLAVAYSIIEKHRGHIDVSSSPGKGTTVTVYLQASEATAPEVEAPLETVCEKPPEAGRILIMEDEELLLDLSVQMLKRQGHEVASAADREETVKLYREAFESGEPFDVVLLDLTNMVGEGAIEAMENLLEIDPHVRAILVTGISNDPTVSRYRKHGFSSVLLKPYTRDELVAAVEAVLVMAPP